MKAAEWKLGKSTNVKLITKEIFDGYAKSGIEAMEVSMSRPNDAENTDFKLLKQQAHDSGVQLWSFHMPFAPFEEINIATLDSCLRKKSVETYKEYLKLAGELETAVAVIHPSGEPNRPEDRYDLMKSAKECLAELAEEADKCRLTLAVEDLPRTCLGNCSAEIKELISADSRLRVCFDTNHLLAEKNVDFIKALGDKIVTLHVSDYDFRDERHWLPYEGKNNWVEIVSALEDAGYCGPFLYELGYTAPKTITRRTLTHDDFAANYKACVNKTRPEVIGVPNEDICANIAYYKTPVIN